MTTLWARLHGGAPGRQVAPLTPQIAPIVGVSGEMSVYSDILKSARKMGDSLYLVRGAVFQKPDGNYARIIEAKRQHIHSIKDPREKRIIQKMFEDRVKGTAPSDSWGNSSADPSNFSFYVVAAEDVIRYGSALSPAGLAIWGYKAATGKTPTEGAGIQATKEEVAAGKGYRQQGVHLFVLDEGKRVVGEIQGAGSELWKSVSPFALPTVLIVAGVGVLALFLWLKLKP